MRPTGHDHSVRKALAIVLSFSIVAVIGLLATGVVALVPPEGSTNSALASAYQAVSPRARLPFVQNGLPEPVGSTGEWTQHAHDAQHTGYTDQVVNAPWRWKWAWNGPNSSGGVASGKAKLPRNVQPVTGGGRVYVAAGERGVFAMSEATGAVLWNATDAGTVNSTVAYDADTASVFAVATNGTLYKLSAATGSLSDHYSTGGSSTLPLPPAVVGDRVFFSMGNSVYAINKYNMGQIWAYDAGSPVQTPPAYSPSRNRVIAVSQDLYAHAVDNANGQRAWRVKPTARTAGDPAAGPNNLAQALNGWPVIAEIHGLVLVRYRLDWSTLWTWDPWPTTNSQMRTNLQSKPDQQALFALSLDNGAVPFVSNVGNGAFGDGGYLQMGPQPVVKRFSDGAEVAYTVIRGNTGTDARWDSKLGEMVLDSTTVPGYQAGYVRFIYYDNQGKNTPNPYLLTDEQPSLSMAGDYLFGGHWMAGYSMKIADRSSSRGSFGSPITTTTTPQIVNSSTSCSFSASHYCARELIQDGDPRVFGPNGFYIYYNQPHVYDQYWSSYAGWTVSNGSAYFVSIDGAVVALESGNPTATSAGYSVASAVDSASASADIVEATQGRFGPSETDVSTTRATLQNRLDLRPTVIPYTEARSHAGEVKTIEGAIQYIFNNRSAVYLRFTKAYYGDFVVRILKEHWPAFGASPDNLFALGQTIQVTGRITWYNGDPVIYVDDPGQIVTVR